MKTKIAYIIIALQLALAYDINAQCVGINKVSPTATLDILSGGNSKATSAVRIINSSNTPLLNIFDDAKISVGNTQATAGLDIHITHLINYANSVGIGTTSLTATAAKAGAIRFEPISSELQFSDGTNWKRFASNPDRESVVAVNNSVALAIPQDFTNLTDWAEVKPSPSFDATTGEFTAPQDGFYTLFFKAGLLPTTITPYRHVEGQWILNYDPTLPLPNMQTVAVKALSSYTTSGTYRTGITCSATIYLNSGDRVRPRIWHNLGSDTQLSTGTILGGDGGFNYLAIIIE